MFSEGAAMAACSAFTLFPPKSAQFHLGGTATYGTAGLGEACPFSPNFGQCVDSRTMPSPPLRASRVVERLQTLFTSDSPGQHPASNSRPYRFLDFRRLVGLGAPVVAIRKTSLSGTKRRRPT